jgi:hypothetical protein
MATAVLAQQPSQIPLNVQLYLASNGVEYDGIYAISLSLYQQPVGGTALYTEDQTVAIERGTTNVLLGSVVPVDNQVFATPSLWLGVTVDGTELLPRMQLVAVPYARLAEHALVAASLSAQATGVVSSVNEISGRVMLIPQPGMTIIRSGNDLRLSVLPTVIEQGEFTSTGMYQHTIAPRTTLEPTDLLMATVISHAGITAYETGRDVSTNTITIHTSAALLASERVVWQLYRKQN